MRQVTTGIQGLDAQFGGGIPTGTTILALSEPSNAPYLLCEQFAAGGLNALETVLYYNLERPKEEVWAHLKGLVAQEAALKNLQYYDCYSAKFQSLSALTLKRMGIENHSVKVPDDVPARVLKIPKEQAFRVVIESVNEAITAYGLDATMKLVTILTGLIKSLNGTALLMHIKGLHEPVVETRLKHAVDGVIEFGVDRQGFGLYSYLSVTKMRGVSDATRLLLYKETDKGLWLESTRRVF